MIEGVDVLKKTLAFSDAPKELDIGLLIVSILAFLICCFFVWVNAGDYGDECAMCLWFFGVVFSLIVPILILVFVGTCIKYIIDDSWKHLH